MEKNILYKHGLEDIIKIAVLFKANYRVKIISVNIPILFLQKCKSQFSNSYRSTKDLKYPKQYLKRTTYLEDLCFLISTCYQGAVIKNVWYWYKHILIDSETELRVQKETYTSTVYWFSKRVPRPFKGEKNSFFNKWCWDNCLCKCTSLKLDPDLKLYIKVNSKWINSIFIKSKAVRFLEENNTCNKRKNMLIALHLNF